MGEKFDGPSRSGSHARLEQRAEWRCRHDATYAPGFDIDVDALNQGADKFTTLFIRREIPQPREVRQQLLQQDDVWLPGRGDESDLSVNRRHPFFVLGLGESAIRVRSRDATSLFSQALRVGGPVRTRTTLKLRPPVWADL